jgi:hypothetical protein
MIMTPGVRKVALAAHIACSVGWIGGVVAYLTLGVAAVTSQDTGTIRAAWTAMDLIGSFALVPLALAALLTGLIMSLGTNWGVFRHYWTLMSFVLTVLATIVLVVHMLDVSFVAEVAQGLEGARLEALGGDLVHPGLGLVVLLVIHVLNVYKPRGLTPYGWRKQHEQRTVSPAVDAATQRRS